MSAYYYRDGILYQTKTMCNLVETWQHECRVYPDESRRWAKEQIAFNELFRPAWNQYLLVPGLVDWAAM